MNFLTYPSLLAFLTLGLASNTSTLAESDGEALRAELQKNYPSLVYVQRYRASFPLQVQADKGLWDRNKKLPALANAKALTAALAGLQDQHVSLAGPKAGKAETLGLLFRDSSDGHAVVWRVFDPSITSVAEGDEVVAINQQPITAWLKQAAAHTFGGSHRTRMAGAVHDLGLGSRVAHENMGLASTVTLTLRAKAGKTRTVELPFLPMNQGRASDITAALNRADLPRRLDVHELRIGTLRLGAFAPQFDPAFNAAAEAAEKEGMSEDAAMVVGFCAVVQPFIDDAAQLAKEADLLVLDLRGNFGGFGREARLFAKGLASSPLPQSFDVFATANRETLRLERQIDDPACGQAIPPKPLIVLTDAATRSSGELISAWLWGAHAIVVGERGIGGGGGLDSASGGFALAQSGFNVRFSGNFTFFDNSKRLKDGEVNEAALIDLVAQDGFAPSRTRPFAIQAVGLRPDLETQSSLNDLQDGGLSGLSSVIESLRKTGKLICATGPDTSTGCKTSAELTSGGR